MVKFLPSYVGSKSFWVKKLERYKNRHFVELFCGSAVLSANLASEATLNDLDPFIYKILSRFDELEVPSVFTKDDYFEKRKLEDWWRWSYCLSRLSYSGVFRYSKNGFNVPIKTDKPAKVQAEYLEALEQWKKLQPVVLNQNYSSLNHLIKKESILVIDPPYENTLASYNNSNFDYHFYWEYVRLNENICRTIILFDFINNLPFAPLETKNSRVNGARAGNTEGVFIFEDSYKSGYKGEEEFAAAFDKELIWIKEPFKPDFQIRKNGKFLELKSDYHSCDKTPNFFMERYSDKDRQTPGGPWQALEKGSEIYVYYFVKNKKFFVFNTQTLVNRLDEITQQMDLIDVPNKTWTTSGFKVKRDSLKDIYKEKQILNTKF